MASPRAGRLRLLALAVATLAASACGTISSTAPPATPTDFPGLAGRFNVAGIEVSDWVSGDAGCMDPDLVPTAISFDARGIDQASDVRLYLYVFRNRAAFERLRDRIGPCAASFVTDVEAYEEIQQSPYVLAGQGPWAPDFEAAVRRTLEEAAGTGG
ncbi:MAG: hypothetical protein MUQ32_15590 [Chloroflexi bacterium]|nr:hypothetical protein [Chloroflexota bacterium]